MTLCQIRPTLLRRTLVVLTVAAIVVCLSPLWLIEAIAARVRENFGEDIGRAWGGGE
jgi:hypothetical protein